MSRPASPETQLRTARTEIRKLRLQLASTESALRQTHAALATSEKHRGEWIERFDKLLARTPEVPR